MIEAYLDILEEGRKDLLIPFLKSYTAKERHALVPTIKKEERRLDKYEFRGNGKYSRLATDDQLWILSVSTFACFGSEDRKALQGWTWRAYREMDEILDWHCPSWFSAFIHGLKDEEFLPVPYLYVLDWQAKGYLSASPELLASILPMSIYVKHDKIAHSFNFRPGELEKNPITLEQHIWYLFEYPTIVNRVERFLSVIAGEDGPEKWMDVIQRLTEKQQMDRMRVLKESLLAVNRNFNKTLTAWFVDLFLLLDPAEDELIRLQDQLFSALSSVQSKAVGAVLTLFKKLYAHPDFRSADFIAQLAVLFSSEVKSVVKTALSIAEKIAESMPAKRQDICIQVINVFLSKDEALQLQAAKLIRKYGDMESAELKEAILPYAEAILMSVKPLLQPWLTAVEPGAAGQQGQPGKVEEGDPLQFRLISADQRIPELKNLEDLIFLAGQSMENNEPYHFDLLPAAILQFSKEITGETIAQLEPAFLRAYKVNSQWSSGLGLFDRLLAAFLISYSGYLTVQFPEHASGLQRLKKQYSTGDLDLDSWSRQIDCHLFDPFKMIFDFVLEQIKKGSSMPLLSTSTHSPAYIDPKILVHRLKIYQEAGAEPHTMDLQLALQRCALDDTEEALALAKSELSGEYKALMVYFLDKGASPAGEMIHTNWWLTAAILRKEGQIPLELKLNADQEILQTLIKGEFEWKASLNEYLAYGAYNYEKGKSERYKAWSPEIIVKYPVHVLKKRDEYLFVEYFFEKELQEVWETDIPRLMFAFSNHPDLILSSRINQYLKISFSESDGLRAATKMLIALRQLNGELSPLGHLTMAAGMLHSDKTIRGYAAELWSERVGERRIVTAEIGRILGLLERIEWAPLKRLTDLMMSHMMGLSTAHDMALEELIVALLSQLETEPIKNLKKLLEIYHELIALNGSTADLEKIPQLSTWHITGSLKKVVGELLSKN